MTAYDITYVKSVILSSCLYILIHTIIILNNHLSRLEEYQKGFCNYAKNQSSIQLCAAHQSVIWQLFILPDSMIHESNVGLTWGRQDPGGPHVGHTNLAIWE